MKNRVSIFWQNKGEDVLKTLRKAIIEIFVIVFGVTLSIWLNDKSNHSLQQQEVKEFLLGLKGDLMNDITEMKNDKYSYLKQEQAFEYITSVKINQQPNQDSLKKYYGWIFNQTFLIQNNGRFEGFKSSGKIGNIEDKALQIAIMDLYQEQIPSLLNATNNYIRTKEKFSDFVIAHRKRVTDSTTNIVEVLAYDQAIMLCRNLSETKQIRERYDICIMQMDFIVSRIDKLYKK